MHEKNFGWENKQRYEKRTQKQNIFLREPLLVMTFSEKECTYIMTPFVESVLSALGVCRKLPRAVVYGPIRHQGMGVINLYTLQCLLHVKAILCSTNKVSRHMIVTAIENTLLEAGVPSPLFRQPYCKYVTKTWVAITWEMARVQLDLDVDDGIKGLPILCEHD